VNNNILTNLHKDGKEWEQEVRVHSATGCCRIISVQDINFHKSIPLKIIRYLGYTLCTQ
jgi:hypothetical protein